MEDLRKQPNPASAQPRVNERTRIPMSVPAQKLEVAALPGFHMHWFLGVEDRIERALQAGYEFVSQAEARPNSVGLGSDSATSGNTDMGSRVSIVAGKEMNAQGQPARLYLMKLRQEWWEADQKKLEERNDSVAAALMGGQIGLEAAPDKADGRFRYVGSQTKVPELFRKGAMAKRLSNRT